MLFLLLLLDICHFCCFSFTIVCQKPVNPCSYQFTHLIVEKFRFLWLKDPKLHCLSIFVVKSYSTIKICPSISCRFMKMLKSHIFIQRQNYWFLFSLRFSHFLFTWFYFFILADFSVGQWDEKSVFFFTFAPFPCLCC